ncbi:MAG: formylglycine-generating enzyme family protein [Planctomycetota bacterium]
MQRNIIICLFSLLLSLNYSCTNSTDKKDTVKLDDEDKKSEYDSEITLSLCDGISITFVLIPAGTFRMGRELSPHEMHRLYKDLDKHTSDWGMPEFLREPSFDVTITEPFYLSVYEITQQQYAQIMGSNPSKTVGKNHPVESVTWYDAMEYCKKVSSISGFTLTLPTQAQWENACRGGSRTAYHFGDDIALLDQYAWYRGNSENKTHPVGLKNPNQYGLYDMHGNVLELSLDGYFPYTDGHKIDIRGDDHVDVAPKGGSYRHGYFGCRSFMRDSFPRTFKDHNVGFRVCINSKSHIRRQYPDISTTGNTN